jgi:alkyldihydroxyacetonephosphate synthase
LPGKLKFWGWGFETEVLRPEEVHALEAAYAKYFGVSGFEVAPTPKAEEIQLRAPRVTPAGSLADICSADHYDRLLHSFGRSFFDSARIFARDFSNPPDVVAFPNSEGDIVSILGHTLGRRVKRGGRRRTSAHRPSGGYG